MFRNINFISLQFFAHHKGGGSTKNGRDSAGQRLGVKAYGGEKVTGGSIIVRQRGLTIKAGENVGVGKDYTLFALKDGEVVYDTKGATKKVSIKEIKTK